MDFSAYQTQLIKTILSELSGFLIILLFVLLYMFKSEKSSAAKGTQKMRKRSKKAEEDVLAVDVFALLYPLMFIVFAIHIISPIAKDIRSKCYIQVHGEYQTEIRRGTRYEGTTKYVIMTTDDGQEVHLDFSKGIDMDDFPENETYGTAIYAENSKYILEFIPDEPADNK